MTDYEEVTVEITLSSGKVLIGRRIPPGDTELFEDAHIPKKPPMREAKAAGGVVEMVPDLDDKDYKTYLTEFKLQKQEDMRRMIFDHVEVKDVSEEEIEKLRRWGIVPTETNALEEKDILIRHYMTDYFVDWMIIRDEIMRISVVTEGEVQRALERFQRYLGRGVVPDKDGNSEESVSGRGGKGAGASSS